jgi:hypothetical protein
MNVDYACKIKLLKGELCLYIIFIPIRFYV